VLYSGRTFFGVHRVVDDGEFHRFRHGTTLHGLQSTDPDQRLEPFSYYHRGSPIGQALTELPSANHPRIGVVGLGTGTLACYARWNQEWIFWEIDPAVERIARNPDLFTYLADCPGRHRVVLGDARLTMAGTRDASLGVLVLDAFTSDAIPVHLLTREAFQLYFSKLTPDGVLAVHISNRYLDLEPVIAALVDDLDLFARIRSDRVDADGAEVSKKASEWVVLARDQAYLGRLNFDDRWAIPEPRPGFRAWSDDFSDVYSVFKW
jgi:spermidine synthase